MNNLLVWAFVSLVQCLLFGRFGGFCCGEKSGNLITDLGNAEAKLDPLPDYVPPLTSYGQLTFDYNLKTTFLCGMNIEYN